jgi:pantoate--beta-alanine ligase
VLWRAIQFARERVRTARGGMPASRLAGELSDLVGHEPAARLDYVAFVDPETLEPLRRVKPGAQLVMAVFVGQTRLIDNARLE